MGLEYGFVLVLVHCLGNEMNCDVRPVDNGKIYATLSECEWEKQRKAAFYGKDDLECAEVKKGYQRY